MSASWFALFVQTQVEKVLASWRKEKVFSEATIALCAASLDLSNLGADAAVPSALPQPSEPMQDGAIVAANAAPPSPANSLFSEPSAGSIDAAVLDAFPPKTVASANVEPLPRLVVGKCSSTVSMAQLLSYNKHSTVADLDML